MKIRDPRQPEKDDFYTTYGRPSVSAWVAAASVAFAFFLLGGFIKTYRQLESLREESRREISELRESMRRLQNQSVPLPVAKTPQRVLTPLPQAVRRDRDIAVPAPVQQPVQSPPRPRQVQPEPPAYLYDDFEEREEKERPRYQLGRRSAGETGQLLSVAGGPCQVVSVATAQKRIMMEGGRDLGLDEGARLELCRDGRWIADLRVVDVYDNQSSCEVLHATLPPEPGDTVRRAPQSR